MVEKLTEEDWKIALSDHAAEKGHEIWKKYGPTIDFEVMNKILKDQSIIRFPVTLEYNSQKIDSGLFAVTEKNEDESYTIFVHEFFKDRKQELPALILYQLVLVNYGEFANLDAAEVFASSAMGMERDAYYHYICKLVDSIPE